MSNSAPRMTLATLIHQWKRDFRDKEVLRAELAVYDQAFTAIDELSTRDDALAIAARVAQLGLGAREFEEMSNHWYQCRCPGSAWPGRSLA